MAPSLCKDLKILDQLRNDEKCIFCGENVADELIYGKIYKFEDVITHYFCMLFSAQMEQNGKDEDGILGFLPQDIKKEISRGAKIQCVYCHHGGATVACSLKSCKRRFHYPCGIENGSLHQFFDLFKSYCVSHRKIQNVPAVACKLTEKYVCHMCQDEVKPKPSLFTIWAPCCKTAWFHRNCIQKMAMSAGYFFKCPHCNNKDEFRKEMRECGIYIPDQDASWELEPNAFGDHVERYNRCDTDYCQCPEGRNYALSEGLWAIILCSLCGSHGIHAKCGENILTDLRQWTCSICSFGSSCPREQEQEPGPAFPIAREEVRSGHRGRPRGRRRKTIVSSDSEDEIVSWKKKKNVRTISSDSDSDAEKIEFAQCDTSSNNNLDLVIRLNPNVVSVDSDENESDVESNSRSTTRLERQAPVKSSNEKSNINPLTCGAIIDLDADEEIPVAPVLVHEHSKSPDHVTSTSVDDIDSDASDDVVFVSCHSNSNLSTEPTTTAMIRFVDNNIVYFVSPADVKRNGGIENLTKSSDLKTETSQQLKSNISPSAASWLPIPLHKSFFHSLASNQPNIHCPSSLDNFIQNNNEQSKNLSNQEPHFCQLCGYPIPCPRMKEIPV